MMFFGPFSASARKGMAWSFFFLCCGASCTFAAENPKGSAALPLGQRLASVEKKIDEIGENQKKIEAKNAEIKTELDNLRVWIRRR